MASRKHKSISSRPTTQYDTRRFHFLDAWNWYTDNVLGRNILPERKVKLYHIEFDDFKTKLERRNLHKHLTNLVDGSIDVAFNKKKLTKLPGLSDSASLSHRHFSKRMTVHPQKMNSLSAIVALSEFIAFSRKNTSNIHLVHVKLQNYP